jgi:hypothetical protein
VGHRVVEELLRIARYGVPELWPFASGAAALDQ